MRSGRPQFESHYQPHVPSALGYYDLGEAEAFQKQADLADVQATTGGGLDLVGKQLTALRWRRY